MQAHADQPHLTDLPPVLGLYDLGIGFKVAGRIVEVVDSASIEVYSGRVVGLVGESGSGKSVTAMAASGLLPFVGGQVMRGRIELDGSEVTRLAERAWARLRGRVIGSVFQNPTRSLNPAFSVGSQISEVVRRHNGVNRASAWRSAVEMLDRVGIPDASRRARDFPHQFSGGMCQRVSLAMALACGPRLLIADEPTTALDATIQKRVLDLMLELRDELALAVLLITHDLGVVAYACDDVAVMYAGQVVERGLTYEVFRAPQHPYTAALLDALPKPGATELPLPIPGIVPHPTTMISGCRFFPRCQHSLPECQEGYPELLGTGTGGFSRCIRAGRPSVGESVRGRGSVER